ncbi:MAG: SOS response-associated peptidase [Tannerellaceae bacterium]|nr:SOS response-associated peptidase [Tannerellaceae bacterium]
MCFHNAMSARIRRLAARYGRKTDILEMAQELIHEQYHVNAFTYPLYPVVTRDMEIQAMNWGLIPSWVKTIKDAKEIRTKTLNARAETIFEKPSFREPARHKRCLIPATGFFEWRHEGGEKIPYYIHLKGEEVFSMAGLYDIWRDPESNSYLVTFTQITTEANPLLAFIHNSKKRMPAILPKEQEELWLDPDLTTAEAGSLLLPYEEDRMDAYVVDKNFVRRDPFDPDIIEKLPE